MSMIYSVSSLTLQIEGLESQTESNGDDTLGMTGRVPTTFWQTWKCWHRSQLWSVGLNIARDLEWSSQKYLSLSFNLSRRSDKFDWLRIWLKSKLRLKHFSRSPVQGWASRRKGLSLSFDLSQILNQSNLSVRWLVRFSANHIAQIWWLKPKLRDLSIFENFNTGLGFSE